MSEMSSGELISELRAIRAELEQHNRVIRRNRLYLWGLGLVVVAITALGVVGYVNDARDDRRECRTDNGNSVRDSEVLIGAVLGTQEEPDPELLEMIEQYRNDVRRNLRDC